MALEARGGANRKLQFPAPDTGDAKVDAMGERLHRQFDQQGASACLRGQFFTGIVLKAGDNEITHALGYKPTAVIVTKRVTGAVVTDGVRDNQTLHLTAAALEVLDLWVW